MIVFGGNSIRRGLDRYYPFRWFIDQSAREMFPREDWDRLGRTHVADLRATAARRAGDVDVVEMVTRLRSGSAEFEQLWDEHEVAVRISDTKRILHPEVGLIDVVCETLLTPSAAQHLLVYRPCPGSDAQEKLDLLRVVGTQAMR